MSDLNNIKRDLFYDLLNESGRVFIHAQPSMELEIGRRGLVGDELKEGITLVFNSKMKFDWGDYGIETTLVFGTTPEKCFIPNSAIDMVYSPEMKVQLTMELFDESLPSKSDKPDKPGKSDRTKDKGKKASAVKVDDKVIQVDFRKKPVK